MMISLLLQKNFAFEPFAIDFAGRVKEVTNGGANVAIEVIGNHSDFTID